LSRAGINASALDKIRLAQGVVGKSSYVAGAALLTLAVIAVGLRGTDLLFYLGCFVLVIFVLYFLGVMWFAHKHPGESLLEGAELIQWRQIEMAAKDVAPAQIEKESQPALIEPAKE
jgi:hypothetical protein